MESIARIVTIKRARRELNRFRIPKRPAKKCEAPHMASLARERERERVAAYETPANDKL